MFYIRALIRFIALQRQSPTERFAPPQPQPQPLPKRQTKKFELTWKLGLSAAITLLVGWQAWSFLKASMRPDYVKAMTRQGYQLTAEKMQGKLLEEGPGEFYQLVSTDSPQQAMVKLDKALKQSEEGWEPDAHQRSIVSLTPCSQNDVDYRTSFLEELGMSLPLPANSSFVRTYSIDNAGGYINTEFFQVDGETIIELVDFTYPFS